MFTLGELTNASIFGHVLILNYKTGHEVMINILTVSYLNNDEIESVKLMKNMSENPNAN
jgi:hypothetical protein